MANTIKLKRSAVPAKVPTTGDLQLGELALNTYDGKLYTLKNDGVATIVQIGATATTPNSLTFNNSGSGGVSGSTFDGNSALTVSYNTIGAPSTTGTNASGTWGISITGNAASATTATQVIRTVTGTTTAELVRGNMADNDQFRILVGGTGSNAGFVEIATADDGTEPIHVRQYTGVFATLARTATLLDGSGNTTFPGVVQGTRFTSTVAAGTAPFTVTSDTVVTNLNADLLDGLDSVSFLRSDADNNTATGGIFTTSWLEAGRASGSVALTTNDGYGNANIAFNHKSGIPDVTGNSGRISVNVDSTSGAVMGFKLKSTTTTGVATMLTEVLTLSETNASFIGTLTLGTQASATTHAVRAGRSISTSGIATGGGNLTADRTINVPGTDLDFIAGFDFGPIITSSTGSNVWLPSAGTTQSGVVTAGTQTFAGVKTFSSTITGSVSGNAGTATTLATTRTLWGQNFNGGANVTGNLTSVGDITGTGAVTLTATSGTLGLVATGANIVIISTDSNERVRVTSTGDVGIGTTNPGYKLEVVGSFAATTKSFVIPHPTREGYKLRYGSLEGPENGVYVRGRSKDFVIELPEYWTELVDADSITVNLTPIGKTQTLWVKDIKDNKIYVGSKCSEINYFYMVFAERADVEKLEVELPSHNK